MVLALLAAVALQLALASPSTEPPQKPWIGVDGNHLVNRNGETVRLLGVNRSGTEYQCVEAGQIFDGPNDGASIRAMKTWKINAVRLPLNESCWLGADGVDSNLSGQAYRDAIRAYVQRLERAGLYVILELHWAAPGHHLATGLIPMPDADHAPEFWRSVASEFRGDRSLIFDLYNEPRPGVSWDCWKSGCELEDEYFGKYQAVGMQELLDTVRSTGAAQPVMLGGVEWASDLSGWLAYAPEDPLHSLVAANHTYDFTACRSACRATLARIAEVVPVVTGELGESDCRHGYIDSYMRWADRHGISYLGWTWNAENGWTCQGGPSLIKNYSGAPTAFGIGFREHLRRLARG